MFQLQLDKLKRKALLAPAHVETGAVSQSRTPENYQNRMRHSGGVVGSATTIETVVGGMEASGVASQSQLD
jgi:hypothetical protein